MTRVLAGNRSVGARSLARFRAIAMASAFSALVISAQLMRTSPTPGNEPTRSMMSRRSWARSGHPEVVSASVTTTTAPSGVPPLARSGPSSVRLNTMRGTRAASSPWAATTTSRAMPSSTMLAPSSGSTTWVSTAVTSSTDGACGSCVVAMATFYWRGPCKL